MTERVADYSYTNPFGDAAGLKKAGFSGVGRYISHDSKKDLSPAERDDLLGHDVSILLVFESVANRATQGHAAGAVDGAFANDRANALGYPADCTLCFAVDFDGTPAQVQDYFDGVGSAGGRLYAPYGSERIISGVRYTAPRGWQTAAWSRGKVSPKAGILQNGFKGSYDSNDVLVAAYGQWHSQGDDWDMATGDDILKVLVGDDKDPGVKPIVQAIRKEHAEGLADVQRRLDALEAAIGKGGGGAAPTYTGMVELKPKS